MDKLQANIILEILGRPPEHIKQSLSALTDRLNTEKGIKIVDKIIHEPIQVKDSKDLFTTFAELTLELDSLDNYFGLLFSYMPSNIELIHPEKMSLTNLDLNELANRIAQRLHDYDAITKKAIVEKEILMQKLSNPAQKIQQSKSKQTEKIKQKNKKKKNKK